MELVCRAARKRKSVEGAINISSLSLDGFNQDILERVLSWLPPPSLFRSRSVCKGWKSIIASSSFKLACAQIPSQDPWFFMNCNYIPVAASGGLVCFRDVYGNFIVCNPVAGSWRQLPPLDSECQNQSLHAVAMKTCSKDHHSYKLVLVCGQIPKLTFEVFDSSIDCWTQEAVLGTNVLNTAEHDSNDDDAIYYLSKAGNVVTNLLLRSPSKQYSSVITTEEGEEIVHFISSSGTVVACNMSRKCFLEYPRLLPVFAEYSIDVVECRGEMLVVLLSEFLESASLRVWKFNPVTRSWHQIAAMPPAMAQEFYGNRVDINCVGAGNQILICFNFTQHSSYVLCDLVANVWTELPKCSIDGEAIELMSAFSFEPRVEVSV